MLVRPESLQEFVGQQTIKDRLQIAISAAHTEVRMPKHMLFTGPPGLGKTSMASVVASELGVPFHDYLSANIDSVRDMIQILKPALMESCVVFVDEVHRLDNQLYEFLHTVMEDRYFSIGNEKMRLKDFVFIGASTEEGNLPKPFLDRFGLNLEFERYSVEDLSEIISNYLKKVNAMMDSEFALTPAASTMIAERSQGTPRIALGLCWDIRDVALSKKVLNIDETLTEEAFNLLHIPKYGLSKKQVAYVKLLSSRTSTVGLQEIAVMLGESKETIERAVEPALLHLALVERTKSGRTLSLEGRGLSVEL